MLSRLREAKRVKGLTNDDLSNLSGVSLGTINKVFAGQSKEPHLATLCRLTDALCVDLHYIIYGVYARSDDELSLHEFTLIKKYRVLDDRGKENVVDTIEKEYMRSPEYMATKKEGNTA